MHNGNITERFADILEGLAAPRGTGRIFIVSAASRDWAEDLIQVKGAANAVVYGDLASALANCIANKGDVIWLMPGTYTLTAAQAVSVAGVTIRGIPGRRKHTIIVGVATASTNALNITAADVSIRDLTIKSGSSSSFALSLRSTATHVEDCIIAGNVVDADGAELQNGADDCTFINCLFEAVTGAASAVGINMVATAAGAPDRLRVIGCSFRGWTTMITDAGSAATAFGALLIKDCDGQIDAGDVPANYVKLDTVAGGTGAFESCRFATATNAIAKFVIPAGVKWVANATEAGWSTARPA